MESFYEPLITEEEKQIAKRQQQQQQQQQPWWVEDDSVTTSSKKASTSSSSDNDNNNNNNSSHPEEEDVVTINIDDDGGSIYHSAKSKAWWLEEDDDNKSSNNQHRQSTDWEKIDATDADADEKQSSKCKLLLSVLVFVSSGVLNVIYGKLQMIPMYNYPTFLNLWECIFMIPIMYGVFLPMVYMGQIPSSQFRLSKWPFVWMGFLDGVTGWMQVFASDYLSGPLIALLPQACIPINMLLAKFTLGAKYSKSQITGSAIVILGILIALGPALTGHGTASSSSYTCLPNLSDNHASICKNQLSKMQCLSHLLPDDNHNNDNDNPSTLFSATHRLLANSTMDPSIYVCKWEKSPPSTSSSKTSSMSTLIWSAVMILSCVPASISNIYKEGKMERAKADPIYLTTWVGNFQTIITLLLIFPTGLVSTPKMYPMDWLQNFYHGTLCYFGKNSLTTGDHPDQCHNAFFFVNMFILWNSISGIAAMYVIQYGSSNIMFIAATVIVPISNLAFSLPSIPGGSTPINFGDIAGLLTIVLGIVCYHFGPPPKHQ